MSAKANPVRVGTFVVGAIGLLVAALIGFGSGHIFKSWLAILLGLESVGKKIDATTKKSMVR